MCLARFHVSVSATSSGDDHGHHHHNPNLRATHIHVLADALTSVTAIVALTAGKFLGWLCLDPVMGIVGSAVVFVWAYGLVRDTSGILLDSTAAASDLPDEIMSGCAPTVTWERKLKVRSKKTALPGLVLTGS